MINKIYRLVSPKQIVVCFEERSLDGEGIIVRPTRLSICAADQRYYTGARGKKILDKKLPMALIHEAVGEVVFDPKGEYNKGDTVIMIPNTPIEKNKIISENYLENSKFRASGYDGFMQDYVFMARDRIVKYINLDHNIAAFTELVSVAMHAISRFAKKSHLHFDTIGVWGDGNLGFIISLILKTKYPKSKIIVFGKNEEKLNFFSFVDEAYQIESIPSNIKVDHAFEAVGGKSSQYAIDQILEYIRPEGTVALLGVAENPVEINTRIILEKGITLLGNSRSGRTDFEEAVHFLEKNVECQSQLSKIISKNININNIDDIIIAFEYDLTTPFKTIMDWNI
ncbi:zinc-binding dehydrogenase [Romboutsia lituseburensis]|uniref:Ribulose-5-phosphate reductase n=1 Tax=Romboutsia lituseburensis DSM 797 TaxID=1121325 RepID=A0A1G9QP90_9FIRM|nr:zinc-binding dehydrogenase [Romboutsia lituseburensis]CEH35617.1 Alcohol dehydrogenase GroES-like domain-containing protein [Romboutsia lituseburensis]SDM12819.1 ribitol-5-phosphate 2-dehydrogenase [Romboutsia lituseburensis DSM 797]